MNCENSGDAFQFITLYQYNSIVTVYFTCEYYTLEK